MATTDRFALRYPVSGDAPTLWTYLQNLADDVDAQPAFRGSGTDWPADPVTGDTFFHSTFGCLFLYAGGGWRPQDVARTTDLAGYLAALTAAGLTPPAGLEVLVTGSGVRRMHDGTSWRQTSPSIIGRYDAPWPEPEGEYSVTPSHLTTFAVPDPGVPFRAVIDLGAEYGSMTTAGGWDLAAGTAHATNNALLATEYLLLGLTFEDTRRYRKLTSRPSPVLTGALSWRVVARRRWGTGNGWIGNFGRQFSVTYYAA